MGMSNAQCHVKRGYIERERERERENIWYCVSILQEISIGSVSDISVSIYIKKIYIFDNTTLHLAYYNLLSL